jgi:hypothetical protein
VADSEVEKWTIELSGPSAQVTKDSLIILTEINKSDLLRHDLHVLDLLDDPSQGANVVELLQLNVVRMVLNTKKNCRTLSLMYQKSVIKISIKISR